MTSTHTEQNWQASFVAMLPEIQQRLRYAFRHLDAESRDDATEEGIIHALLSYMRLFARGRASAASAASLAWYAAKQVKRGRPAAGRMNLREPLSRYAQFGKGFRVERLHIHNKRHDHWIDNIVEDKRSSVSDTVAVRLDAHEWLATLSRRTRQIAKDLAFGFSTNEVAKRHGVTAGRISQVRQELHDAWEVFQGEPGSVQL